jgi:FG-GAP repeat protein/VCBS repeat protein
MKTSALVLSTLALSAGACATGTAGGANDGGADAVADARRGDDGGDPDAGGGDPDAAGGGPDAGDGAAPSVPVLKRPLSNAYVGSMHAAGSRKPIFEWRASTVEGGGTIRYDLQYSTDPSFGTLVTTVDAATLTSFQPSADLAGAVDAPVGARYYWRARACSRSTCSAYSAARLLNIGRSDNDFNGDGYADLAVGDNRSGPGPGHVYVYLGPALDASSVVAIAGTQEADGTGERVAVGDWNGDGFSDLAIGAPYHSGDFQSAGQARVYFGGATFDTTADRIIDGAAPSERFGSGGGNLGDVNGDGFDDLGVGVPGADNGPDTTTGRSDIFFGGAGTAFDTVADAALITPGLPTVAFGSSGMTGTDLDCDGYADVVEAGAGGVVFYGGSGTTFDTTPDVTLGPTSITSYGVASAGDVDSDGCGDLVRGYRLPSLYAATVVLGSATEPFGSIELIPPISDINTGFGWAVSGAGDIDGDGFADVVVGSPWEGVYGRAHVYLGGAAMNGTSDWTFTSPGDVQAGSAVAGGSDVNGDGIADIAVSALMTNSAALSRVFVLHGGTPFDAIADRTLDAFAPGPWFGSAVGL